MLESLQYQKESKPLIRKNTWSLGSAYLRPLRELRPGANLGPSGFDKDCTYLKKAHPAPQLPASCASNRLGLDFSA